MTQFIHQHILSHRFHYTEMTEMYISLSLRATAQGMAGIFVPVYLYDLGYGLSAIAAFFLVASIGRVFSEMLTGTLVNWIGPKHVMMLSYMFLISYFGLLYMLPDYPAFFFLSALMLAFELSTFWCTHHLIISQNRSQEHSSSQVSLLIILQRVFTAAGPLAGGLIAANFGFRYSLLAAAFLLIMAAYPLLKTPDNRPEHKFDIRKLKLHVFRNDTISTLAWQFSSVVTVFTWPIYIFIILKAYDSLGFIFSLSIVMGVISAYYVGKLGDRGRNPQLLKLGSLVHSMAHVLRVTASSFSSILGANVLTHLAESFAVGPFTESFYERADKKSNRLNYIISMQIWAGLGKALTWVFVLVVGLFYETADALTATFVAAAILVLLVPRMSRSNNRLLQV